MLPTISLQYYKQYIKLMDSIKELDSKRKEIGKLIQDDMIEKEIKSIKTDFGIITIRDNKRWTYSEETKKTIEIYEKAIKGMQAAEQASKAATCEIKRCLVTKK